MQALVFKSADPGPGQCDWARSYGGVLSGFRTLRQGVSNPEFQSRVQTAMKRGFQTQDAEMALARVLGDLANRGSNT